MSLRVAIFLAFLSCCRASVLPSTVAAPRGPITCVAEDPEFERLVVGGLGNQGEVISEHEQALFHEAGVWLPETGEWLFTSNRLDDNGPRIKVHVLHAKSRTLTECDEVQAAVVMANGGTSDGAGGVLLCSQGMGEVGGAIYRVSPTRCSAAPLVEARFNSPNDVVLHRPTGAILFTDPSYGVEQGFRSARHHEHEALWCFVPAAEGAEAPPPVHCLDRNFVKPNGLCLSPDGATLYVTDSGYFDGYGGADRARPREVYAYDLTPLPACPPQQGPPLALRNRRLFYRLSEGEGIPDGMKVDRDGRLFIGCGDGVHVCAPDGRRLGKFKVEGGGAQLCFGGEAGRTLLILSETRALTIELTTECGL